MRTTTLLSTLVAFSPLFFPAAFAQDGSISGPTTSPDALHYVCPAAGSTCSPPGCMCASTSPPGGLHPSDVPQFVVFTADDAIQQYTLDALNLVLNGRKNPNGCPVRMTYFNSIQYTNFSLVTEFFVAGNEIADHTMTHVGSPDASEINGNLIALNTFAGIPLSEINGFRAPFLNFTIGTFQELKASQFLYDSSATSSVPVTDPNTDAYWPYTLDFGLANNCLNLPCGTTGQAIPGLWEIPMYAIFDEKGAAGPHLMDPWLDAQATGNISDTLSWMQNTFSAHYSGNRQPFGVYTHPIHFAPDVPNQAPQPEIVDVINKFLDWAQEQQQVWIISNIMLLDWMRNPVPASQLNTIASFGCPVPQVSEKICDGIPENEMGLLDHCDFVDFPWSTCYGCPSAQPLPGNPSPPQVSSPLRFRIPSNCSTPFWDPIKGQCTCTSSQCQFTDNTRPIGPNGGNLTTGGTGAGNGSDGGDGSGGSIYTPFDGAVSVLGEDVWRRMVGSVGVGVLIAVWALVL